jgi:hypothetical protein
VKYIRGALAFLALIFRALIYRWLPALLALIGLIADAIRRWCLRRRLPDRLGKAANSRCVPISDLAYKRPDPLIYDQYYLMSQNLAVSWDNPDIELRRANAVVPSHAIQPDTEYEIVARIWNGSTEAPIVGLPVTFSYLSFGIGTVNHPIGQASVDLGVKGGPGCPAFASIPWRTPQGTGHFCIQAQFEWSDDVNPGNNLGQENLEIVKAHSPARTRFELRNDTDRRQEFRLEADAYAIPPLPPCGERRPRPQTRPGRRLLPGTILSVPSEHDRANYPLPDGWTVEFAPERAELDAGETRTIEATVTPAEGFSGRREINVHAFRGEVAAGGVTLIVEAA